MKSININRREFLSLAAGGAAAALMPLSGCKSELAGGKNPAAGRPNIIFLLTDDQRADAMGCMGNPIIHTPNMDGMAKNGVLFTNAFVTTSICCSSRASIFTGQYSRRHGINDFAKDFSESALAQTYPMLLRRAGYRIGFIGKYGVGKNLPGAKFNYWAGIGGQPKYEHKDNNGRYKHLTQIMAEQSIEFLRTCPKQQPFCLSVSFKAPHVQDVDPRQFIYDRAYKNLYSDVTIPTPKTADSRYFEALPEFLQNSEARRRWQIRFSTPEKFQESVKGYYRLVTGVDVVIGQIRDELKRLNFNDNTVIILTSDNGFYLGERGLAGKWFAHEESIRVPLVVFDPRAGKKARGVTVGEIVLNIDIAPTILELAGLEAPQEMRGHSLIPLLTSRRCKWRTDFFYEHLFSHPRITKSEAVRTQRWKYIRYFEQQPIYEELFDLKNDPRETVNLTKDERYRKTLKSLRKRCDELLQEAEDK